MQEELFDVIDETGRPLRTASWAEVHAQNLLHQTAAILLFKDESRREVLVHRRSAHINSPNLWQHSAGGHLVSGDTPEQAVRKEIQEELFHSRPLPEFPMRKICDFRNEDMKNNREILHLYEGVYPGPFFPNPEEVAGEPEWREWNAFLADIAQNPEKYARVCLNIVREYLEHR